jgi:hypothetical protein
MSLAAYWSHLTMIRALIMGISLLAAGACSTNPLGGVNSKLAARQEVTEHYYIFDVRVDPSRQEEVFEALSRGARRNAPNMSIQRPLEMGPLPEEPARFTLEDPLSSTTLGSLAALSGAAYSFKVPNCDGARLVGAATESIALRDLRLNVCMFPYQGGYGMNVFTASTQKRDGGVYGLIQDGTARVIGDDEAWEEIAVDGMLLEMAKLDDIEIELVESSKPLRDW